MNVRQDNTLRNYAERSSSVDLSLLLIVMTDLSPVNATFTRTARANQNRGARKMVMIGRNQPTCFVPIFPAKRDLGGVSFKGSMEPNEEVRFHQHPQKRLRPARPHRLPPDTYNC